MATRFPIQEGRGTAPQSQPPPFAPQSPMRSLQREVSLAETLDRVLHKGAVVVGEATISVANIDLLYLGLNLILTSMETVDKGTKGVQRNDAKSLAPSA